MNTAWYKVFREKLLILKQFEICTRHRLQDCILQAGHGSCASSILAGFQDPAQQES